MIILLTAYYAPATQRCVCNLIPSHVHCAAMLNKLLIQDVPSLAL